MFASKHIGAVLLAFLVAVSGCAGIPTASDSSERTTETTGSPTTDETPEKGTTLIAVSKVAESNEDRFGGENTVAFENLTRTQQREFEQAINCTCSVETYGFGFGTNQQVYAVVYEGDYYKVLVLKV